MVEATVIVRALNEERHIGRLFEGLREQSHQDHEVVLVDSGSTDATVRIAESYGARTYHIPPSEFTFGRSLNIGCQAAKGKYLVLASAHVYPVYPDWLALLLAPFDDPSVALVYGRQTGTDVTHFSEQQVLNAWFPETSNLRQLHPFANNANAAIRRELWVERPYDESLTGLEDLDWAKWALNNSYHIAYEARAQVVHVHEESSGQTLHRYEREAMALKRIFPHERMTASEMIGLISRNVLSDAKAARDSGVLSQVAADIVRFRALQFLGAYRGLNRPAPLTQELRQKFYYPQHRDRLITGRSDVEPIDYSRTWADGASSA